MLKALGKTPRFPSTFVNNINSVPAMADLHLELNKSLDLRIAQFKNDPDKMRDVNEFLNELFDKAQREVAKRNGKQKGKLVRLLIPVHIHKFTYMKMKSQYLMYSYVYIFF